MKSNPIAAGTLVSASHRFFMAVACAGMLVLAGCATAPGADPRDPLEPLNRGVTRFNDAVDDALLKPAATAYREVMPSPVRTGVSNFFGNLGDVWSFVNHVLQFKGQAAVETCMRVGVNTVFGLGGVLDIASELGLERRTEDFGQTLGRWGVPSGPYLVLPLLGPSSVRDAAALRADVMGSVIANVDHVPTRNSLSALKAVDTRARLLRAGDMLDQAALDPYTFTRDAYLQKRRNDVFDGSPPPEPEPPDTEEAPSSSLDAADTAVAACCNPPSRPGN